MTAEKGGFQRKPVVPCPHCFATSNHHSSLSTPRGSTYWIKHFSLKCISGCLSLHLFWSRGLAVDVKRFCQNNPQTHNAPRRWLVDYKSTSMKTSLVASGLRTANLLHLIRQIPWTVLVPVPHGELLLQRPVAPLLQRRSPQLSSHVEQPVLGHIGCQSRAPRQEGDYVPISGEAALRFDHFVCSTLLGPGLRASHSQLLNGELVAVT